MEAGGLAVSRPAWLRVTACESAGHERLTTELAKRRLRTVCRESACPNIGECFSRQQAAFMILGPVCTRTCRCCRIHQGRPRALDRTEPLRVAEAAAALNLKDVVVTSVSRDDLPDGGAGHFAATIRALRGALPTARIEALIPDFSGDWRALERVMEARPDVINHNLGTAARIFPVVRHKGDYRLSLTLLRRLVASGQSAKSGLMVGLGESRAEIREALQHIRGAGVESVTIGQYLPPTEEHWPVARYWRPAEFMGIALYAQRLGFKRVISGPLVRSSYRGSFSHLDFGGKVLVDNQ